jgi:predicted transposase/invertase (TIGR01784 family)
LEVARSLFQAYTDQKIVQAIDWDTLQIADAVRRLPNRRPLYTDITYHALTKSGGSVYFHVEQERGIDKRMVERILQYNAGLYSKHRNQGHDKLPLIINFVVYNGTKEDYPSYEDICEYFEEPELARLVIGKVFNLLNLNKQNDEDLVTHGPSGIMEVLLKRASRVNFTEWMQANKELMRKLSAEPYLNTGLDYVLGVGKDKAEDIINSFILVYPKLKDAIMTAATQLRREGEKIGMKKGMEKEKSAIAQSMFKKGLASNLIQEVTGLSLEQLKKLHEN